MTYNPPIQKSRSRYGLPGRQSQAIAMAIQASIYGADQDASQLIPGQGLVRHNARMAELDPVIIKKRAKTLGYAAMDLSDSIIPSRKPVIVAPGATVATVATVAPMGGVVMATAVKKPRKPRVKRSAVKAVMASAVADAIPAILIPVAGRPDLGPVAIASSSSIAESSSSSSDFCEFVMNWATSKIHSRGVSVMEYLKRSFDQGKKWNPTTKRWVNSK